MQAVGLLLGVALFGVAVLGFFRVILRPPSERELYDAEAEHRSIRT
jgi:hypothetical protein